MIVEWCHHLFHPDLKRYPFHPQASYTPDLSGAPADPLRAYLDHMDREGIDRAVLVHPEPYGDDHRLLLECLEREPRRFRGTCLFYPRDPDAPRKLADLVARQPLLVALRFHAHRGKEEYLDGFADRGVRALWEKALELGLIIELHIGPNYAGQIAQTLRDYPESAVHIDHLAEPHLGTPVEYAQVLDLAAFPKVQMKLAGLSHFASDGPLFPSARSFTRRVIAEFGPDRMVWSGGTPRLVDAHMEGYGEAERLKVKGGNLARLLGFN
jgi:predicted TIM-barrel fold metal-dependent hydrolase